jgi:hypothetical protein
VEVLVRRGANIDATNEDGDTAMKAAKEWDHEEVIEILKQARAARKQSGAAGEDEDEDEEAD